MAGEDFLRSDIQMFLGIMHQLKLSPTIFLVLFVWYIYLKAYPTAVGFCFYHLPEDGKISMGLEALNLFNICMILDVL